MALDYLEFDYSEDEQGIATWDAMACVRAAQVPALVAEISLVLSWALRDFAGQRGAPDDGGDWDYDLQAQDENEQLLPAEVDHRTGQLTLAASSNRTTVNFSISGTPQFADALREAFALE
jgi:hypothetical protein